MFYSKKSTKIIKIVIFLSFLSTLFSLASPFYISFAFGQVGYKHEISQEVILCIGIIIILLFDFFIKNYENSILNYMANKRLMKRLMVVVQESLLQNSDIKNNNLLIKIRNIFSLSQKYGMSGINYLADLPLVLFILSILFIVVGYLAFITCITLLMISIVILHSTHKENLCKKEITLKNTKVVNYLEDFFANSNLMISHDVALIWENEMQHHVNSLVKENLYFRNLKTKYQNLMWFFTSISFISIILFCGIASINHYLNPIFVLPFIILHFKCIQPFQFLLGNPQLLFDIKREIVPSKKPDSDIECIKNKKIVNNLSGEIKVKNGFYRATKHFNINSLQINAKAGEILAITGRNDAGKSIVIDLLSGKIFLTSGLILIDEIPVEQITAKQKNKLISIVTSNPLRLPILPISDLAKSETVDQQYIEYLCDQIDLKFTYKTIYNLLFENNKHFLKTYKLSKGEGIILSLIQSYLKKSKIIFIDELIDDLSYLDEFTCIKIINILKKESLIIIVTRKIQHLWIADKLLLLDNGQQKFFGNANQVLANITKKEPLINLYQERL